MNSPGQAKHSASDQRLRFLLVTTFYPPFHFGGDALYVRQLAHVLAARGHRVDVVHSIDAYQSLRPGRLPEPLEEPNGVRVMGLKSAFPVVSSLITQQTGRPLWFRSKLRALFDQTQYDVIHYHNISLVGGPEILNFGIGIKLYTAHEHWLVCPTHVLWRHNREPCTARQCLRCVAHYRRPPQLWRHTGFLASCAEQVDAFIALSAFSARKHQEFGFSQPMRVMASFMANQRQPAVDSDSTATASFKRVSKYLAQKKHSERPWFLFVGRLEKIKGVQDAIALFREEIDADLCIVGAGDFQQSLMTQAQDSACIEFLGVLAPADLAPLYRQCTAVVLPSICYEVFPMVALEAFQQSTPIIARARGPFVEIIEHSQGGLLFDDAAEFRRAVRQFVEDRTLRDLMGQAARHAFENTWSEQAVMQAYFALIKEMAIKRQAQQTLSRLDHCKDDGTLLPENTLEHPHPGSVP